MAIEWESYFEYPYRISSEKIVRTFDSGQLMGDPWCSYLALPNTNVAVERVAARVKQGGHDIPAIIINRRFHRSLRNLIRLYMSLVNRWKVFDNYSTPPVLIARGTRNRKLIVQEQAWQTLNELAQKA